jgi:glycosyltransferase involved in cell wall biosynthesis
MFRELKMPREPIANDLNNPLVSVLVYNYFGEYLEKCFESILSQTVLDNIEVIFIDNASTDGSFDIALDYANKYQGAITVKRRNRRGDKGNLDHCLRMAKGKYCVPLCNDDAFLPEYVKHCIQVMDADHFATFDMVKRRSRTRPCRPNVKGKPLVSVLIHNYNYGRYLRQCLESALNQTYNNIEIIFSDNASTDESWDIAVEYARNHPGLMTIIRNRKNFGPASNLSTCYTCIEGKYFCILCSDDALMPDFVERCVSVLEANPDAGFAMTHRRIIDEHGTPSDEPPFYNKTCIIPGPEQAAVYMMAAVNPSISQIMYNRAKAFDHLPSEGVVSRWYAQRILDFNLCCHYSMAYIKEPLLIHRVHSASDSYQIATNVMEAFGQFILPHQFVEMAAGKGNMEKVIGRLPQALEKLGRLCLRYCTRALSINDEECALRYFHLSVAIMPAICQDPIFVKLRDYWTADATEKARIVKALTATDNLTTRTVSYDPPPGSVPEQGKA